MEILSPESFMSVSFMLTGFPFCPKSNTVEEREVRFPLRELVAKRIVRVVSLGVDLHLLTIQLGVRKGTGAVKRSIASVGLLDGTLILPFVSVARERTGEFHSFGSWRT